MHIITSRTNRKSANKAVMNIKVFRICQLILRSYLYWSFSVKFATYFSRFVSWSRQVNLCIVTGKGRSVYRAFRMTRNVIHKKGMLGLLNGMGKSSW